MPSSRPLRGRMLLGAVVPVLLLFTSCAGDDPPLDTTPTSQAPTSEGADGSAAPAGEPSTGRDAGTYVALGDSFASAPLVPETDPADGCQRSSGNYANLVAAEAGYKLVDVSCIAASTTDMLGAQATEGTQNPPQLDAVDRKVGLVTLTIGGNDFGLFSQLLFACLPAADQEQAVSCRRSLAESGKDVVLLDQIDQIRDRVEATTRGIRDRAPRARVVVVNYPQLLPDKGVCPDLIPLPADAYSVVGQLNQALSDAVRLGGKAGGAQVVDLYRASKGHDICSDAPWVNGIQTDPERALALHPFAEGQRAVADLLLDLLE